MQNSNNIYSPDQVSGRKLQGAIMLAGRCYGNDPKRITVSVRDGIGTVHVHRLGTNQVMDIDAGACSVKGGKNA